MNGKPLVWLKISRMRIGWLAATRVDPRPGQDYDQPEESQYSGGMTRVRTIPRESAVPAQPKPAPSNPSPRQSSVRAVPVDTSISPSGSAPSSARVHVVAPSRFGDARRSRTVSRTTGP